MLKKYKLHFINHSIIVPIMKTMTIDEQISSTLKSILYMEEKGDIRKIALLEEELQYLRSKK